MHNIIEALTAKKTEVRQRAEAYCASIDSVIEIFEAEAVDNPPVIPPLSRPIQDCRLKMPAEKKRIDAALKARRKPTTGARPKGRTVPIENLPEASKDVLKTVAGLPEPVGTNQLMTACDMMFKNASNWLLRATKRGWLKRVGFGLYERTTDFPDVSQLQALDDLTKQVRQETDQELAKRKHDHTNEE